MVNYDNKLRKLCACGWPCIREWVGMAGGQAG